MPCDFCGSSVDTSYYTGFYECYVCVGCANDEIQEVLTPTLVGGIKPLEIGVKMREYTKMLTILCAEHEQEDCLICDDD